jgi:uncharacterized membrane protein
LALLAATSASWLVVNAPVAIAAWDNWRYFFTFNAARGMDFGSLWYALSIFGFPGMYDGRINSITLIAFLIGFGVVALLALRLKTRPRLAQVAFLVIAVFTLAGKVYSPQYVLWLIPLAVLARPRWRDFMIWQAGEVLYFVAIWWHLVGYYDPEGRSLPVGWYAAATVIRIAATLYFVGMVVRDMVRPDKDPVRSDGFAEDQDDPGGGPFDAAPDIFTLRTSRDGSPKTTSPDQTVM